MTETEAIEYYAGRFSRSQSKRQDSAGYAFHGQLEMLYQVQAALQGRPRVVNSRGDLLYIDQFGSRVIRANGDEFKLDSLFGEDMNESGDVLCTTTLRPYTDGEFGIWRESKFMPVGVGQPRYLNNSGMIVGTKERDDASEFEHEESGYFAAIWLNGVLIWTGPIDSYPSAVNERGTVVGTLGTVGAYRPFIWENGEFCELPIPDPGLSCVATAINRLGTVVGFMEPALEEIRILQEYAHEHDYSSWERSAASLGCVPVVWHNGQPRSLPRLGKLGAAARWILDDGQVLLGEIQSRNDRRGYLDFVEMAAVCHNEAVSWLSDQVEGEHTFHFCRPLGNDRLIVRDESNRTLILAPREGPSLDPHGAFTV